MFLMTMPKTFKVGDTADCRINKMPARITWRSRGELVIEPDDARVILRIDTDGELISFVCSDPGRTADDYTDDGLILSCKRPEE
jgi:hypothetical protein